MRKFIEVTVLTSGLPGGKGNLSRRTILQVDEIVQIDDHGGLGCAIYMFGFNAPRLLTEMKLEEFARLLGVTQ